MNPWLLIGIGWAFMGLVMTGFWLLQKRTENSGIVDVVWGSGVALLATFFAVASDGDVTRRCVVAVLAIVWAVRLSGYILRRVLTMPEDGRYSELKSTWGDDASWKMFRFYQYQAAASVLFAIPMLIAARNQTPFNALDVIGVCVFIFAIVGESVADYQLHCFRSEASNHGKVCQEGLWRYSRHPNYFFEWLHWWSYVCLALLAPWGWITILGPIAMLFFILFKTGIPPTEEQALRSRGDAYREYQRTTSAFFPWFPKTHPKLNSSTQTSEPCP